MRSDRYQHLMGDFEIQSPIMLGANYENDEEKFRFFGELSNLEIWTYEDNLEENKKYIVEWKNSKLDVDLVFKEHTLIMQEHNLGLQRSSEMQTWIQKSVKAYESGFQDCEKLGGNPLYIFDLNILKQWDKDALCQYFWFPVKFKQGSWFERNSCTEVEKVKV